MLTPIDLENENRAVGSNGIIVGYDTDGFNAKAVWKCEWIIPLQYSGLKDRNQKEVYEGDVIKGAYEITWLIKWDDSFSAFIKKALPAGIEENLYDVEKYEIIGNIYENPGLLN
jgi:hypothetical protein